MSPMAGYTLAGVIMLVVAMVFAGIGASAGERQNRGVENAMMTLAAVPAVAGVLTLLKFWIPWLWSLLF